MGLDEAHAVTAVPLVLVHDRGGVAVGQPVLVGKPVGSLVTP
jgi:hypothetical protein